MDNDASGELDFKRLFESAPGLYLVLDPNLRIVAASDAYLQATLTRRADILGQDVFEAFPDPLADATGNSRASFNRVLQNCVVDTQSFERHDVRKPDSEGGGFEVRYWSAVLSLTFGFNDRTNVPAAIALAVEEGRIECPIDLDDAQYFVSQITLERHKRPHHSMAGWRKS